MSVKSCLLRGAAILVWICMMSGFAAAAGHHYLVTNDDSAFVNSLTFYDIGTNGVLTLAKQVQTVGAGIGGGYFGVNRIAVLNSGSEECVYASDASGDIVGINVRTLEVSGSTKGSEGDTGNSNGIGLAMNGQYLYASFTDSNTIGTFQIQSGCTLTFVNDISVVGLQGGVIDGMAIGGNTMVVTYGDGSIESFNIASGTPVSNGDEQNSTAYLKSQGISYPTSVEITKDGHYAIFGDTSTSVVVEVSDISSGKLSAPILNSLGTSINSSNILLSPDESLLYISNTQGDKITAASFDKNTGQLWLNCYSTKLRGYSSNWSYLATLALATNSGTGGMLYVAEFGASSIAMVDVSVTGGKCTMTELTNSPISDPNSTGLLSIGIFPPLAF
ncbi:MAG: beta-propeller fold lactonase family protein [Candidatus Sulfotelmatobacter sp.]